MNKNCFIFQLLPIPIALYSTLCMNSNIHGEGTFGWRSAKRMLRCYVTILRKSSLQSDLWAFTKSNLPSLWWFHNWICHHYGDVTHAITGEIDCLCLWLINLESLVCNIPGCVSCSIREQSSQIVGLVIIPTQTNATNALGMLFVVCCKSSTIYNAVPNLFANCPSYWKTLKS